MTGTADVYPGGGENEPDEAGANRLIAMWSDAELSYE